MKEIEHNFKDAIIDKVSNVLNNAPYITDAKIEVNYHRTEITTIKYEIQELILEEERGYETKAEIK